MHFCIKYQARTETLKSLEKSIQLLLDIYFSIEEKPLHFLILKNVQFL